MVDRSGFLEPSDPSAFLDWSKKDIKNAWFKDGKECPICRGFGGWNLRLNAYPLHGKEDTAENRHLFSHFRSNCSTCNGWGYVAADMNCPGHKWNFVENLSRCHNRYQCSECGAIQDVDSSD